MLAYGALIFFPLLFCYSIKFFCIARSWNIYKNSA